MKNIKITLSQANKISQSNKTFIVINLYQDEIIHYNLTNDLHRYYKKGLNTFRLVDDIKSQIQNIFTTRITI
jgi:hypothetical protein